MEYLNNYIDEWFIEISNNVKHSSKELYMYIYRTNIKPFFNDISLDKINNKLCNDFKKTLINKSNKYKNLIITTLKKILKFLFEKGYLSNKVNITNYNVFKNEIEILSANEYQVLINYLVNNNNSKNIGILLGILTGLRIGEICALKYESIDLDKRIVEVTKTLQRIGKSIIVGEPKSKTSYRKIPLASKFITELNKTTIGSKDHYLLTNSPNPYEPRSLRRYFTNVLNKLNLKHVTFHSLRHGFATRCIELGFEYKTVSELLGHSSVNITLDLYVHPDMKTKREYIEKLSQF